MDIDISVLRLMEREKDVPFEVLASAIEEALLTAYEKTDGAVPGARVELNRKSGHVSVLVPERRRGGHQARGVRQHPRRFRPGGRRDRPAGDHAAAARCRGRAEVRPLLRRSRATSSPAWSSRAATRRTVLVDLGKIEAIMPLAEQVPGERYSHGTRIRVYVVAVRKELRGPQVVVSRTHPDLVEKLFALEVPEIADGTVEIKAVAREAGHRSKIAVISHNPDVSAKGACIGPMGSGCAR